MKWLELTVFFWGLWNPVAGFEHIYQKGKTMNSAFLSWNMIKVTYIYVGQQMARCLPKTPVCQCIKSWGHFCLYVLWYLIFEMPPIKPHQQVCKALKEPCWSCKGKWSVVCTSAACVCKLASTYIHRVMVFSCTIMYIFVRNCCPIQYERFRVCSERDGSQDSCILLQKLEGMQQMMMRIAGREWLLS